MASGFIYAAKPETARKRRLTVTRSLMRAVTLNCEDNMPEFHIDLGNHATKWKNLDKFSQGYIEGAFFTEGYDDAACDGRSFSDLAPETLKAMLEDCTDFNHLADAWLGKAYLHGNCSYDMYQAGIDFWFTRNGHGAGFWDRGLGAAGDKLTEFAHTYGSVDLYVGDDGKIYQS